METVFFFFGYPVYVQLLTVYNFYIKKFFKIKNIMYIDRDTINASC